MSLQEKVTQEDLIFYEILRHPVFSWEYLQNLEKLEHEEPFEYTDYQKEFVCDFNSYVSFCCGRAVGKTEALSGILIWLLINNVFPDDFVVYTVPNKAQLEPVWSRMTRIFRTSKILKTFIQIRKGINSSSYTITLLNGGLFMARIAGTMGDGRNVIGLHTPFEIVDEAGYYPWPTWLELQPTLNTWNPGMRQMVSGVPTGFREHNVLFHADMQNSSFTKHRISAHRNPRYTADDEKRSLELYKEPSTEEYIHFVLGRHGKPTFAVFDRALMQIDSYPVWKLKINGIELSDNLAEYIDRLSVIPKLGSTTKNIFGIDLGYTDPTEIIILYINKNKQFKFHAKIELNKVPYPVQAQIINYLDSRFNPEYIGIDEGHAGIAEVQKLQIDPRYAHKNYKKRIIPIRFNSSIVIGLDEEGKEIKEKTRPYSISVLQEYSNEHRVIYSYTDLETITELERMVYITLPSGNKVYRTMTVQGGQRGADHITAALLCATMAWYISNESFNAKPIRKLGFVGAWNR